MMEDSTFKKCQEEEENRENCANFFPGSLCTLLFYMKFTNRA